METRNADTRNPNHPGELSTDAAVAERTRTDAELSARREAIVTLQEAGVPFVVGGMYAFAAYSGIWRDTKDLDVHVRPGHVDWALNSLERVGWRTERRDDVWLHKAFKKDYFVDFVFCSGNGVCSVDDDWFNHAKEVVVLDRQCLVAPAEEQIWSKAFVNERERFDGADINHLILKVGHQLDWARLLGRFDRYWELLLGHLMMFRFAYPSERDRVPHWVMSRLLARTLQTLSEPRPTERVCRGTLLSRATYTVDVEEWGFQDGREWDLRQRAAQGLPVPDDLPRGLH